MSSTHTHTPIHTYHCFMKGHLITPKIDYTVISHQESHIVKEVKVESNHPTNTSAHDAISVTTTLQTNHHQQSDSISIQTQKIQWQKVDQEKYKGITDRKLRALSEVIKDDTNTAVLIERLNKILLEACKESMPPAKKKGKLKKFKWNSELLPLVKKSKRTYCEAN